MVTGWWWKICCLL